MLIVDALKLALLTAAHWIVQEICPNIASSLLQEFGGKQ
jgi:hypothetical protein